MICHKDKTFCATSGTCANTACDRWIDFGEECDLPVSMAEFKDTEDCAGFIENPTLKKLKSIMEPKP